ncbi:MAG: TIR domain-containing protein [Lachnospiraceae bacterium]|nr:TIR domain-containing protein [Lachnospiraceae bacterium]
MAKLCYKTRGNSSPQGKSRVYFSCHPQDFDLYFPDLSDEILKKQNCVIWYDAEPYEDYVQNELLADLEEMQLFVVPITTRFLYRENRARDLEFQFAQTRHIPILPVMVEGGLETEFNIRCGNIQFLDRTSQDMTAISYDEKLSVFLSSVLVGDKLADQIRAAFDAYVFLSYRKKDRKYAQQLMKLIHKNKFCRDIAIWYDEFLVPGHDFNQAIINAMEKSSLFALAVTPNLLEDGNYVMTVEYTAAKNLEKKILPVEIRPTDQKELKQKYPNIPDSVNAFDEAALADSLLADIRTIATGVSQDPQHLFLIGLAYLNGIDLEVDAQKALELIQMAAQKGLPEALQKLVYMHRMGEVVSRDYHMAAAIQQELTQVLSENYKTSKTCEDALVLLDAMKDLGDFHYELRNVEKAIEVFQAGQETGRQLLSEFPETIALKRLMSAITAKLGNVYRKEGNLAKAREQYAACIGFDIEFGKKCSEEHRNKEEKPWINLIYTLECLAACETEEEDFDQAQGDYSRIDNFIRVCSYWMEEDELRHYQFQYQWNMGRFTAKKGKSACKQYYLKALELAESLLESEPSLYMRRNTADLYFDLGKIQREYIRPDEAEAYFRKALALSQECCVQTESVEDRIRVANCYGRIGELLGWSHQDEELAESRELLQKALEVRETVAAETHTVEALRDLAEGYAEMASYHRHTIERYNPESGSFEIIPEAFTTLISFHKKAIEVDEMLAKKTLTLGEFRRLMRDYESMGEAYLTAGIIDQAQSCYKKSIHLRKSIYDETETSNDRHLLILIGNKLGSISLKAGDLKNAREYYEETAGLTELDVEEFHSLRSWCDLMHLYDILTEVYQKMQDSVSECELKKKAVPLREKIEAAKQKELESAAELEKEGDLAVRKKDWSEAQEWYETAASRVNGLISSISTKIVSPAEEQDECTELRGYLSYIWYKLGDVCLAKSDTEQARRYYQNVADPFVMQWLTSHIGKRNARRVVREAFLKLIRICEEQGDTSAAQRYRREMRKCRV